MDNLIYIGLLVLAIVIFFIIFKINLKKAKQIKENKELEKITDKFPENIEIIIQFHIFKHYSCLLYYHFNINLF